MNSKISIITTTYNNQDHIQALVESCARQTYKNFKLIIADDGSTDRTNDVIEGLKKSYDWLIHLKLPHGERGIARYEAIQEAQREPFDYLYFIDSDMILEPNLLKEAVEKLEKSLEVGALVVKEIPVSNYTNLMTKIKVFERTILNNAYSVDKHSIEAARFWRAEAYKESGGINPKQISFEETQPTIRYLSGGGCIERLVSSGVIHDEKQVTLKNLLDKKKYHFQMMPRTLTSETNGFWNAFTRWYFFRPVLYQSNNLKLYVKHPLMTAGMLGMYLILTFIGVIELVKAERSVKYVSVKVRRHFER